VIDGMSLADAMARSPETFPRVYVAMVQAGETGGFLDVVLAQIADFQAREKELKNKVLTAMLYPAILLVLALGVLVFCSRSSSPLPTHVSGVRSLACLCPRRS
jgi:type IV pilus assembly protein PilC